MELKEFTQLVTKDSNEAKNLLSYLIGILRTNKDSEKALLNLYESFPTEIKKDEKLFAPIICKLLNKYGINNETYAYYEKFNKYWTPVYIDTLKKENPKWSWEKTVYNNSLEFMKAVSIYRPTIKKNVELINFLEETKDEISRLILKDSNKFITNGIKNNFFYNLIKNDYIHFKNFCSDYNIDYKDILKKIFFKENGKYSYKIEDFIGKENNPEVLIEDLLKEECADLLKEVKFFDLNNKNNLLNVFIISLHYENYKIASIFLKDYEDFIKQALNTYLCKKEYKDIDLEKQENWDLYKKYANKSNAWDTMQIINSSFNNNKEKTSYSEVISKIKLNIQLNELPVNELKAKRTKI